MPAARSRNHNKLLGRVEGVDGIKTGYTRASGFNLMTNRASRRPSYRCGGARRPLGRRPRPHHGEPDRGASHRGFDRRSHRAAHGGGAGTGEAHVVAEAPARPPQNLCRCLPGPGRGCPPAGDRPGLPRRRRRAGASRASSCRPRPSAKSSRRASRSRWTPPKRAARSTPSAFPRDPRPAPRRPSRFRPRRARRRKPSSPSSSLPRARAGEDRACQGGARRRPRRRSPNPRECRMTRRPPRSRRARGCRAPRLDHPARRLPRRAKANELIDRQDDRRQGPVASRSFIEKVIKDGTTLCRARFSGFDEDAAQSACKVLKSNGFSCFATRG